MTEMRWAQWPAHVPRPTPEEWTAAEARYRKTLVPGDQSDWPCGLELVMATYNRWLWWPLFFPDAPRLGPFD